MPIAADRPRTSRRTADLSKKLLAVGDRNRLRMLCVIFGDERACVTTLAERLGMSVAAASHHLRALAGAGLLEPRREGKRICYVPVRTELNDGLRRIICSYGI